jgi:hypothetical protein
MANDVEKDGNLISKILKRHVYLAYFKHLFSCLCLIQSLRDEGLYKMLHASYVYCLRNRWHEKLICGHVWRRLHSVECVCCCCSDTTKALTLHMHFTCREGPIYAEIYISVVYLARE